MAYEFATELPIGLVEHVTVHVKLMNGDILLMEMRPTDTDLYAVYQALLRIDKAYHPLRTYVCRLHDRPLSLLEDGEMLLTWIGDWISHGWYRPLPLEGGGPCGAVVIDYTLGADDSHSRAYECALMWPKYVTAFQEDVWERLEAAARARERPLEIGESVVGPYSPNRHSDTMIYMILRYNGEDRFQRCIVFVALDDIMICPMYSSEDRHIYDPYSWIPQSPMQCHRYVIGSV